MIKIFYGTDRQKTQSMIKQILGKDYEVIEADSITRADMNSIFYGTSLFGETRKILLKGLNENKECWEVFPKYLDTTHEMIVWPSALDKRSVVYKALKDVKGIEIKEFAEDAKIDRFFAFKVADEAFAGRGAKAVRMCEQIEATDDAYLMMGAIISQASKRLEMRNSKAVRALKILAKADLDMKSSAVDGWKNVKIALLEIGALK